MHVCGRDEEIERLRGLIADLCDPKPGCWQRALKAGRAEVARPGIPRGAVEPLMVERLSRASGLLEALATCSDDAPIEGVREIATEVAALISDPLRMGAVDPCREALTDDEKAYIVRVMLKIERMNYDDSEPASIIAKLAPVTQTVRCG